LTEGYIKSNFIHLNGITNIINHDFISDLTQV
jgi:hypothetical protein